MFMNTKMKLILACLLGVLPLKVADPLASLAKQPPSEKHVSEDPLLAWVQDVKPPTATLLCARQSKEGYLAVFVEKDNATFHRLDKCAAGYSVAATGIYDSANQELDTKTAKLITRRIRDEIGVISKLLGLTIVLKEPAKGQITMEVRYSFNDEELDSTTKLKLDLDRPRFDAE